MVTSTKTSKKPSIGSGGNWPGPNGKKPGGNGWHKDDGSKPKFSAAKYRITMWVLLAAIVMMFAALSMVYVYTGLSSPSGRQRVQMPSLFFLSTGILLLSSLTFRTGYRSLQIGSASRYSRWLAVTLILGLVFIACQTLGWLQLARQGVYFSGHPHSTFFYFFTAVHGVHLLGGIGLLVYLLLTVKRRVLFAGSEKELTWAKVAGRYWHTMDVVWIWLFILLLTLK
jgi:cytochrome c oxidase subunit III